MKIEEAKQIAKLIQRADACSLVLTRLQTVRARMPVVWQVEGLAFVGQDAEELIVVVEETLRSVVERIQEELEEMEIYFPPSSEGTEPKTPILSITPADTSTDNNGGQSV